MSLPDFETSMETAVGHIQNAKKIIVLSGAGMSTAAGIPDFRSPGGLYGTSERLLDNFTWLDGASRPADWQRRALSADVRDALTLNFFSVNPLPYHEMRRGLIIGLGEGQWKLTLAHVLPELLNRHNKLHLLASQNIDGLDHKVVSDKSKLYNPHGLMSTLVSEPYEDRPEEFLATEVHCEVYQKYVQLVKDNVRDIYADLPARKGKSSHLWPGPQESTPITLEMFGDLLPERFKAAKQREGRGTYSVKPGSVLFDRTLWTRNAAGQKCSAFEELESADLVLVMGTSLSGLTIDNVAHMARGSIPRIVFDMTTAPVQSLRNYGGFEAPMDVFLQGKLDITVLTLAEGLGWLDELASDYLSHLCLNSLRAMEGFIEERPEKAALLDAIRRAIAAEVEREKRFYGDE